MRWAYRRDSVARHHVAAKRSSSENPAGRNGSDIDSDLRWRAPIVLDPVADALVEMAHQELLVAEWKVVPNRPGLERLLCSDQGPRVLQRELLEHDDRAFTGGPIAGGLGRHEEERPLEAMGVGRGRPEPVDEIPTRLPDQDLQVGEDLEIAHRPLVDLARVDTGEALAEIGLVPRAEQAAAGGDLDRVLIVGRPDAPGRTRGANHAVRAIDLVV